MVKKKNKPEYYSGRIRALVQIVARLVKNQPELAEDPGYLESTIKVNVPDYRDKKVCFNCGRSMRIYEFQMNLLDVILIVKMARRIREKVQNGNSFTEANLVHIPSLVDATNSERNRTSWCRYFNLIQQTKGKKKTGDWLITNWGWKFMGGEAIPAKVKVFNGKILERSDNKTTIYEIIKNRKEEADLDLTLKEVEELAKLPQKKPGIKTNQNGWR